MSSPSYNKAPDPQIRLVNKPKLFSYFRASYLLQLMTIGELLIIWVILANVFDGRTSLGEYTLYEWIFIIIILIIPVWPQLDSRSRYQNYKQLKDQLFIHGYQDRILKPVLKSRCLRDAAMTAALELGLEKLSSAYFRSHGYRWYHLLPDFLFRKPHFLLSIYFWKTTFFAPFYKPKVDYRAESIPETNLSYGHAAGSNN